MSILKKILSHCPYREPEETKFYLMLRRGMGYEVEKADRNGYTYDINKFGVYSRNAAFSAVKDMEGNGCLRFAVEKDFLDRINDELTTLQNRLKEAEEEMKRMTWLLSDECNNPDEARDIGLAYLEKHKQENARE